MQRLYFFSITAALLCVMPLTFTVITYVPKDAQKASSANVPYIPNGVNTPVALK